MTAHLVVSQVMPAPAAVVFDTLHDYSRRLEWDTMLREAYTVGGQPPAVGTDAVCTAVRRLGGLSFKVRYVTFQPPDADHEGLAAVKLLVPTAMFSSWAASIRHAELTPGMSSVTYTMTFRCRPAAMAKRFEGPARVAFRAETTRRLAGLADYLASGGGAPPPLHADA